MEQGCRTPSRITGGSMASPPRRLRSGTVLGTGAECDDIEEIVQRIMARLESAGVSAAGCGGGGGGAAAGGGGDVPQGEDKPVFPPPTPSSGLLPSSDQQRLWLADLREQLQTASSFGTREREEVRGLLVITECGGPPADHQSWFWGRVRLYIVVAHHGWAAAIADAREAGMDRLGIRLSGAAAARAAAPAPPAAVAGAPPVAAASGGRSRPSRPSGLRAPARKARPAAPK